MENVEIKQIVLMSTKYGPVTVIPERSAVFPVPDVV